MVNKPCLPLFLHDVRKHLHKDEYLKRVSLTPLIGPPDKISWTCQPSKTTQKWFDTKSLPDELGNELENPCPHLRDPWNFAHTMLAMLHRYQNVCSSIKKILMRWLMTWHKQTSLVIADKERGEKTWLYKKTCPFQSTIGIRCKWQ